MSRTSIASPLLLARRDRNLHGSDHEYREVGSVYECFPFIGRITP